MIEFKVPAALNIEYTKRTLASGVTLVESSNGVSFTHIQEDYSLQELCERLHWMDSFSFEQVLQFFHDDIFDDMSQEEALSLQNQLWHTMPEEDGYPMRTAKRPLTWTVNGLIHEELEFLQEKLNALGIDEVRIGVEMEFGLEDGIILSDDTWLQKKEQFLKQLEEEIETVPPKMRAQLKEKKAAIETFNAKEILMYDLVEHDENASDLLEPIFGTSRDGDGYYDAAGIFELKSKPASPIQDIQNRRTILNALCRRASEYGLSLTTNPSYHQNFSFWKDGKNLFDPENPEFLTDGKAILEGITEAMYDTSPTLIPPYLLEREVGEPDFGMGINRNNYLRFADGRIELRPRLSEDVQDLDAYSAFMLAGALHGLNNSPDILPATQVTKGHFWHQKDRYKVMTHLLDNSAISPFGDFILPDAYIEEKINALAAELGIAETQIDAPYWAKAIMGDDMDEDYAPHLKEFFKKIHINIQKREIKFPEFNNDVSPAFNTHSSGKFQLSKAFSAITNFVSGKKTYKIEIPKDENDPSKGIEKVYEIDINALKKGIKLTGTSPAFEISPGYNMNDIEEFSHTEKPHLSARLTRMIESDALKETSPEFQTAIKNTIIDKFPDVLANYEPQDLSLETSLS